MLTQPDTSLLTLAARRDGVDFIVCHVSLFDCLYTLLSHLFLSLSTSNVFALHFLVTFTLVLSDKQNDQPWMVSRWFVAGQMDRLLLASQVTLALDSLLFMIIYSDFVALMAGSCGVYKCTSVIRLSHYQTTHTITAPPMGTIIIAL